jgi:hypothetical protein
MYTILKNKLELNQIFVEISFLKTLFHLSFTLVFFVLL